MLCWLLYTGSIKNSNGAADKSVPNLYTFTSSKTITDKDSNFDTYCSSDSEEFSIVLSDKMKTCSED
jgi:hypothetical protein